MSRSLLFRHFLPVDVSFSCLLTKHPFLSLALLFCLLPSALLFCSPLLLSSVSCVVLSLLRFALLLPFDMLRLRQAFRAKKLSCSPSLLFSSAEGLLLAYPALPFCSSFLLHSSALSCSPLLRCSSALLLFCRCFLCGPACFVFLLCLMRGVCVCVLCVCLCVVSCVALARVLCVCVCVCVRVASSCVCVCTLSCVLSVRDLSACPACCACCPRRSLPLLSCVGVMSCCVVVSYYVVFCGCVMSCCSVLRYVVLRCVVSRCVMLYCADNEHSQPHSDRIFSPTTLSLRARACQHIHTQNIIPFMFRGQERTRVSILEP